MKAFKSIIQFQTHFNTEEKCREFLEQQRWGDDICCPFCASIKVKRIKDGKRFQCNEKGCRKQFSVTVGTVAENTKIPLTKWFLAMYILSNHSKGISSLQLASWLDITQKSAWHLNHRIREMLADNAPELLSGIVEIDETYVGGSIKNKPLRIRKQLNKNSNKTMVLGAVERDGKVKTKVIPETTIANIQAALPELVADGSHMVTDESAAYNKVKLTHKHETITHRNGEYVRGHVHTNTIEGFWNILKKQINGIHHSVSPKHLQRYCNEAGYRYNNRAITQDVRFANALKNCNGNLTYTKLTSK
jgi:transposase-like protein